MIDARCFKNKHVALFGLGGSGLATAQALQTGGAYVSVWDDNPSSVEKAIQLSIFTENLANSDWSKFEALVLSPGVPLTNPKPHWSVELAHRYSVPIIGDIEIFGRERAGRAPNAPFIAITGTNGKSTTTALIAHILRVNGKDVQLGGNIGTAILTLDAPTLDKHYVIECSSYQIDLSPSIQPSVGVLLNITPDHLDRHGTINRYAHVKEQLVEKSDLAIIGQDDDYCIAIADRLEAQGRSVVRLSKNRPIHNGLFAQGTILKESIHGRVHDLIDLRGISSLRGAHNAQNALAALAATRSIGLSIKEIEAGFHSFLGLSHRMQQVGRLGYVLFVNDSKATNASACATALSSFENIYWIAGGLPKEGGIESLRDYFPNIKKCYLIGEAAPSFAATVGGHIPFEISGTLNYAVSHAARDAALDGEGECVVLFSPACASFDQFANFEKRGDAFCDAVFTLLNTSVTEK